MNSNSVLALAESFGALWGPLYFIRDVSRENHVTGIILCLLLIPGLCAFPIKPGKATAIISILAIVAWIFFGIIGESIGC